MCEAFSVLDSWCRGTPGEEGGGVAFGGTASLDAPSGDSEDSKGIEVGAGYEGVVVGNGGMDEVHCVVGQDGAHFGQVKVGNALAEAFP